jgi:pyruvate formate lyase activating enzyme
MRHVYTGNVHDRSGQSTYCHACDALLIERDWYELGTWGLREGGCCAACGARCPGVFDAAPGRWGSRRLPVRLAETARRSSADQG